MIFSGLTDSNEGVLGFAEATLGEKDSKDLPPGGAPTLTGALVPGPARPDIAEGGAPNRSDIIVFPFP